MWSKRRIVAAWTYGAIANLTRLVKYSDGSWQVGTRVGLTAAEAKDHLRALGFDPTKPVAAW